MEKTMEKTNEQGAWIKCEDCLPEPNTYVLVAYEVKDIDRSTKKVTRHEASVGRISRSSNESWGKWHILLTEDVQYCTRIPYWMPLPELPEELREIYKDRE